MAFTSALNVSRWFLARNAQEEINGADKISNLKMQKLLYYAQGTTLAITDTALFDEPIVAWQHGPVVEQIYKQYKDFGSDGIDEDKPFDASEITTEVQRILEEVYNEFGQFSAWKLRNMTHEESPWLETKRNEVISQSKIKKYFLENYIEQ